MDLRFLILKRERKKKKLNKMRKAKREMLMVDIVHQYIWIHLKLKQYV